MQIYKNMDTGRREVEFNSHRHQSQTYHQHMQQEEWQTQRRRNNNQQVKFNADRVVQQQQAQTGILSIPTKNTYIDLNVQKFTNIGEEREEQLELAHEQRQHNIDNVNRKQKNRGHVHIEGSNVNREQSSRQQRLEEQVKRIELDGYQQVSVNRPGIEALPPLLHSIVIILFLLE